MNQLPNHHIHLPIAALMISVVIIVTSVLNLKMGAINYSLHDIYHALLHPAQHHSQTIAIIQTRLPLVLIAILAGASLAISGLLLQHITQNPLACPSLFGIEYGTAFSVIITYMIYPGLPKPYLIAISASGGLLTFIIMSMLAKRMNASITGITLIGVVFNALYYSLIQGILLAFPYQAQAILYNLNGSLYGVTMNDISLVIAPILLLLSMTYLVSKHLGCLELDETQSIALGFPIKTYRYITLALSILLASITTSIIGPLLFFGLIIPHLVRPLFRNRDAVILCGLVGAASLLLAELIARILSPQSPLPAGLVILLTASPLLILISNKYLRYEAI